MNEKKKKYLLAAGIGAAAVHLLLRPQESAEAVRDGMRLALEKIVPALFPYLVLSGLFLSSGGAQALGRRLGTWMQRAFRVGSGGVIAVILGLTGGYPVGAKTAAQLRRDGLLSKRGAERLLVFCNNAGPAFLFGVVGGACYRSVAVGAALYAVHVLSALLCGFLLRGKELPEEPELSPKPIPDFSEAFFSAVSDAGRTLCSICLLVALFSVCLGAIRSILPKSELINVLVSSFLELSSGCLAIASSSLPWAVKFPLTAAAVGWGGVCVHLQTASAVRSAGLSVRPYLRAKALQAALSALLAVPSAGLIAPSMQASFPGATLRPFSPLPWTLFSVGMACLIFLQFTTSNSQKSRL